MTTVQNVNQANVAPISSDGYDDSWLVAIAKALGKAMGDLAEKMKTFADQAGSTDPHVASEASGNLQAYGQLYQLVANSVSNTISSVGGGLKTLASKNG